MSNSNPFTLNNPNNPFTLEDLQRWNFALKALDQAQLQAEMASQAGIDMTAQLQNIATQRAQIQKFKQVYFPGQ